MAASNLTLAPGVRSSHAAHAGADATYYPWFDWLRAVAACTVMWSHGGVITWSHSGIFAVQVFFALSGWLIGGILLKTRSEDLTRFYFNRAIRIWVPYYLACALLLGLSVLREPITAKWLEIVGYKLTFVYNLFGSPQFAAFHDAMPQKGTLAHVWSVNVEEQFYLLSPLLLVLGARYAGRSIAAWALISAVLYTFEGGPIALGVLAAIVVERFGPVHLGPRVRPLLAAVLLVCVVAFIRDWSFQAFSPIAALSIVLLAAAPGQRHTAGELVGGMSYPLYLNHWIGLFVADYVFKHRPDADGIVQRLLLQAVVNIPLAMALYWWLEKRLLAQRSRWFTPARGRAVTVTAYSMVAIGVAFGLVMLHHP